MQPKLCMFSTLDMVLSPRLLAFYWIALRLPATLEFLVPAILAAVLSVGGLFGSAAILFSGAVSNVVSPSISISRPPGYLLNNENHDACMLVAPHSNSMQ